MAFSLLSCMEAILRGIFDSPTMWSVDVSQYLLILAAFFGSSYAYQEHGHVAVDFLKDIVEKHSGKKPRRVMAVIGYIMAFIVILAFLWACAQLGIKAVKFNSLTTNNVQIPLVLIYGLMGLGSCCMLVTVVFIILDLFAGGDKYL